MTLRPLMLCAVAATLGFTIDGTPVSVGAAHAASAVAISEATDISAARRTVVVRGPRGHVVGRTVVRRPGPRPGPWVRPGHYHWRPGGAIAAGAALGFVAAAAAAAWAGPPPAPRTCWYYTDPSRTQGFWDTCP